MAITGVFLFGWIFLHMAGNLKVYTGAEHYNAYAQFLITMGAPLLPNKGGADRRPHAAADRRLVCTFRPPRSSRS